MKRLKPENPTLFDFLPEFNPLFTLNGSASDDEATQKPGKRPTLNLFPVPPLKDAEDEGEGSSRVEATIAASKSESKSTQTQTGTSKASPPEIVEVGDDGDDISLLYATPTWRKGGTNAKNAISVEQYFQDRDLELAIMASLVQQRGNPRRVIDLSLFPDDDDDDDVQVLSSSPSSSLFRKPFRGPSITERGQSSNSNPDSTTFICEICFDPKPQSESFSIMGCTHSYCSDCMVQYVASKLQENITQIQCPVSGCSGLLEPENCRSILPQEVFDRWGNALCEAVILAAEKFYCPYRDCSALLIDDGGGGEVITQAECPYCYRLFCVQCKVPWHGGFVCEEFQRLNEDERGREDIMLMQLAQEKRWMRCPKCRFYVEKSDGCLFMRCRCGYAFCYNCGASLINHYCSNCKR